MKKNTGLVLFILLVVNSVFGCKPIDLTASAEEAFVELYTTCSMNEDILFVSTNDQYKNGTLINLDIKNIAQKQIIFPVDFNVKLLMFDAEKDKWYEQLNDLQYLPAATSIVMDVTSEFSPHEVVTVFPIISSNKPVETRVVVTGFVYENNIQLDECVGAFIDIDIVP